MGSVIGGWATVVENQLYTLFNGSDASVHLLGTMVANGHLIECNDAAPSVSDGSDNSTNTQIENFISKVFFGFAIPALWTVSGTGAFVVDSGYPCGTVNPPTQDLANQDVTTPGFITLPVCSPQIALASWSNPSQSNSSAPGYPCNPLQGVTKCSAYTYVDQTSSASPAVSDFQTIIKNIQGTGGEWTTGIGSQRDIASYGTCNFGVDNSGVSGDVTYYTGSQDIVSIITESISLYGSGGLVGAKGYMECGGDAGSQYVEWGLY